MAVSQNGWILVGSGQLDSSPIPGTNVVPVPGVLSGEVATLLHWVGVQFNSKVEALYNPGCWGWNVPTPIPGSNVYSNHCSGTAIDFNAPSFPWTLDKMSEGQKQACRNIVAQTEGVVVWGGDFTTKIDQMHFEINGTAEDVARIINKLKGEEMGIVANEDEARLMYKGLTHEEKDPPAEWIKGAVGQPWTIVFGKLYQGPLWKQQDARLKTPPTVAEQKLDKIKELL